MRAPDDIRSHLREREWNHPSHFRDQLLHARVGARYSLEPPTGTRAVEDPTRLRQFREQWESVAREFEADAPNLVTFEDRTLRVMGLQRLPVEVIFPSLDIMARFLGDDAVERLVAVRSRLSFFADRNAKLADAAARHVQRIEGLPLDEAQMMAAALSQARRDMGVGTYLRSLPLDGVDTKFFERHARTAFLILDAHTGGEVTAAGGLEPWLGCLQKGADRLLVRPLCARTRAALCGLSRLWVTSDDLANCALPGTRVLVIENDTPAYELPQIDDAVAIAGSGGNLAWMTGNWLKDRDLVYWGDIDTWGLRLLSIARGHQPGLRTLLMSEDEIECHLDAVVVEPSPVDDIPRLLTDAEQRLFSRLRDDQAGPRRLEQEKLDRAYVHDALRRCWPQP